MVKRAKMHEEVGEIKTDVAVLKEKFSNIEKTLSKIDKAISGNGQPGLVQKIDEAEDKIDKHIIADATWKGLKDGAISNLKYVIATGFTLMGLFMAAIKFI